MALALSDLKKRATQEPKVILMPKVEETPKAEEKIPISELLNQLIREVKKNV